MCGAGGGEAPAGVGLRAGQHGGARGVSTQKGRRQRGRAGEGAMYYRLLVCVGVHP